MSKKSTGPILLISSPSDSPDLYYACEFWAPDPIVFLKTPKSRHLVVSKLEISRARALAQTSTSKPAMMAHTPEELGVAQKHRGQLHHWALKLLRHTGTAHVYVPIDFPHGIALKLQAAGIHVELLTEAPFPEREIKSAHEIKCITESQTAAVVAMDAAISMISATRIDRQGVLKYKSRSLLSEHVQRLIQKILLDHGTMCRDVIVAGGAHGADPHEKGHGSLKANEPIVIDIFPQHLQHGYWGDITRTVLRGKASASQKRMYAAVKASQAAALKTIAPGVKCSRVHDAAAWEFDRRGYETGLREGTPVGFIHSTGHGVGLAIHEAPSIGRSDSKLKVGQIVTVEPGLYYPECGGIRIEDTVCVTQTGCRVLVACEKRFEI